MNKKGATKHRMPLFAFFELLSETKIVLNRSFWQGTTQGSTGKLSPKICGENLGSHIYIDAGEPIRGQYPGHVTCIEQSEASVQVT